MYQFGKPKNYERLEVLTFEEVFDAMRSMHSSGSFEYKGAWLNKPRLETFLKGISCKCCGIKGKYFALEITEYQTRPHINLYALTKKGIEVMMTSDHITPRSKGGGNGGNNRQPLCIRCNHKKGNRNITNEELQKEISW
jgi:hypothetical protein